MSTQSDSVVAEAILRLSDEEIVERVLGGNTALFEVIVRRHNQRLFRAARSVVRDDAEAEDVMQEGYVRAFVNLDQFAGEARFSTWLTKIVIYEALGRLRRAKRQEELPEAMDTTDNPERAAYGRELQSAIKSAVDALPSLYRTVFVLRELDDMSVAETAVCLGITEETVKTRCHRARAFLRGRLERAIGEAANHAYAFLGHRCDRMTKNVMERVSAAGNSHQ